MDAMVNGTQLNEKPQEVVIAVMGATGAGKSTFINSISNSDMRVGVSLMSCTDTIELSKPFRLDNYVVRLVDTPGLDDTLKSDSEVFTMICDYLTGEYRQNRLLHGVIYMHRISDNRMSGSSARTLRFFQELVGPEPMASCALVTNMWSLVSPSVGAAREDELKRNEGFFKRSVDDGAQVLRHDGSQASAQRIVRAVLQAAERTGGPRALRVQRELVDLGMRPFETTAGATVLAELAQMEEAHRREMQELEEEFAEAMRAKDEAAQKETEELRRAAAAEMAKLEERKKSLMKFQVVKMEEAKGLPRLPPAGDSTPAKVTDVPVRRKLSDTRGPRRVSDTPAQRKLSEMQTPRKTAEALALTEVPDMQTQGKAAETPASAKVSDMETEGHVPDTQPPGNGDHHHAARDSGEPGEKKKPSFWARLARAFGLRRLLGWLPLPILRFLGLAG